MWRHRVGIAECFGLSPIGERLREATITFRGDPSTPRSRFDHTSLALLRPSLSIPLWLGRQPGGRLAPIYNFFCHDQPDLALGWSTQVRRAVDWRGGRLTYDSHNGTDFAVPPGTPIVAAAPGLVLRLSNEFNRGGLKVFVDHGEGLFTSYNHLARAQVQVGERVERGQRLGLSGASGIDGFLLFPWSTPHLHFNCWLDGAYVDPFARPGETPLWASGENHPRPCRVRNPEEAWSPTTWNDEAIERALRACHHPGARRDIESATSTGARGMNTHFQLSYFPTRFSERPRLVHGNHVRSARLDLPLPADEYEGALF